MNDHCMRCGKCLAECKTVHVLRGRLFCCRECAERYVGHLVYDNEAEEIRPEDAGIDRQHTYNMSVTLTIDNYTLIVKNYTTLVAETKEEACKKLHRMLSDGDLEITDGLPAYTDDLLKYIDAQSVNIEAAEEVHND